jgi:uncharacterized membrane protein
MRCPVCQRENQPDARFCAFCGSPLVPEGGDVQEPGHSLPDEIRTLRALVSSINDRLDVLEQRQRAAAPEAQPAPAPPPAGPAPVPSGTGEVTAAKVVAPPAGQKPARAKKPEGEWEQILGGSWLARIGILAVIIGVGFFLKFAFDNQWIGPTGRVILGIIAGLIMLGLGYYWRKRYPVLTQVLSGGGIAVLYLSVFAAFAMYGLIGIYTAVAFLLLVSLASAVLSLRYDSMSLAIIGILGAYFGPLILGAFGHANLPAAGPGRAAQVMAYYIVVGIGVLALATFRHWRWFTLLALSFSLITFGAWYGQFNDHVGMATAEIFITIVFLIFVGATSLFHIIWRRVPKAFDYVLMVINAAAYLGISLGIMWSHFRVWMGGFVLLLALFYGLVSYLSLKRSAENARLSLSALTIALVLLTLAIPIQLGDSAWTTIVWAAEFVIILRLSFSLGMPPLRVYSYFIFFALTIRLLFFDTMVNIGTFRPVLNERFLAYAVGIAATYFAFFTLWRRRAQLPEGGAPAVVLFAAANFFSIWILSLEVWHTFSHALITASHSSRKALMNAQNLSLTAIWLLYAVVALVIGFAKRWRYVRLFALFFLAVPIIKVFVYDVFKLSTAYRIAAFVGLGVLLLAAAYLYQRYSKVIKVALIEK